MKIIEKQIKETEMTSSRKENLYGAAITLAEAFYGAAQNENKVLAGKDIDECVYVFTRALQKFIQSEPMWINGRTRMDQSEKNVRVKHFIKTLIDELK